MKLSTKGRYGTRLMLDLAVNYGKGPIFLKDIASRQAISEKYSWHLIPPLKNSGLIKTTRGAHGGYELAKPPTKINLFDIISVLEGPLSIVECTENISYCERVDICVTHDVWGEISQKVSDTLTSITLDDMVERHKRCIKFNAYVI